MRFPCSPDAPIPHLDVNADTGNFTYAVKQMPPGKHYMAAEYLTWPQFAQAWAKVTGATINYKEVSFDDMVNKMPDRDLGIEVALMFKYSSETGYDGGMEVLKPEDLRKVSLRKTTPETCHVLTAPGGHRLPHAHRRGVVGAHGLGRSVEQVRVGTGN